MNKLVAFYIMMLLSGCYFDKPNLVQPELHSYKKKFYLLEIKPYEVISSREKIHTHESVYDSLSLR